MNPVLCSSSHPPKPGAATISIFPLASDSFVGCIGPGLRCLGCETFKKSFVQGNVCRGCRNAPSLQRRLICGCGGSFVRGPLHCCTGERKRGGAVVGGARSSAAFVTRRELHGLHVCRGRGTYRKRKRCSLSSILRICTRFSPP